MINITLKKSCLKNIASIVRITYIPSTIYVTMNQGTPSYPIFFANPWAITSNFLDNAFSYTKI